VDVHRETVLEPDEIVTEILLPPAPGVKAPIARYAHALWTLRSRTRARIKFNNDVVSNARAVLSGAAPIPWRSREIEHTIIGHRLDKSIAAKAAEAAMAGAQPLAQNDYKLPLFRGMIEEELLAAGKAS
jgi:xanthine dehydrogenase YagS FAD-binding subunit